MSDISFIIQNPNIKPPASVVYFNQANNLNLVFTSDDFSDVNTGDQVTIVLPTSVLQNVASDAVASNTDWDLISFAASALTYTFVLSPKNEPISFDSPITIAFTNLQVNPTASNDNVSVGYKFKIGNRSETVPGGSPVKLLAQSPSSDAKDLDDYIIFSATINPSDPVLNPNGVIPEGTVYLSPASLQPTIANRIVANLTFSGQGPMADKWGALTPTFYFSFSTGTSYCDLTDALSQDQEGYNELTSAWKIDGSILATNDWNAPSQSAYNSNSVMPDAPLTSSPTWKVTPAPGNEHIFSGGVPNMDVVFDHVISNLPNGHAVLYIQWQNIPGFKDGSKGLDLYKNVAIPQIIDFSSPMDGKSIQPYTAVQLNWQVFAASKGSISWDNGIRSLDVAAFDKDNLSLIYGSKDTTIVPDDQSTDFYLSAVDGNGQNQVTSKAINIQVQNFPPPIIESFSGQIDVDGAGNPTGVTYNWLVVNLGNNGYIVLDGIQLPQPVDGSYNGFPGSVTFPVNGDTPIMMDKTLKANNQRENPANVTKEVIALYVPPTLKPVITLFEATINRDGNGNITVMLNWTVDHAVYSKANQGLTTVCKLNGIEVNTLDNKGGGNATLLLDEFGYTLEVRNPNAGSDLKCVMPNLSWDYPNYLGIENIYPNIAMAGATPSLRMFKKAGVDNALACAVILTSLKSGHREIIMLFLSTQDGNKWAMNSGSTLYKANLPLTGASIADYKGAVYLAYASPDHGDPGLLKLKYSKVDVNWLDIPSAPSGQSTPAAPSLAVFKDKLYCAYKGFDHKLYVTVYDGNSWFQTNPWGQQTKYAPSLEVFNDTLYCAFISDEQRNNLLLVSTTDGVNWNIGSDPQQTSRAAPSLAGFGNYLYCAFVCNDGSNTILMTQMDTKGTWTSNVQPFYGAPVTGISLAVFDQSLYCAFNDDKETYPISITVIACKIVGFN